jgi:hypothetical protein
MRLRNFYAALCKRGRDEKEERDGNVIEIARGAHAQLKIDWAGKKGGDREVAMNEISRRPR